MVMHCLCLIYFDRAYYTVTACKVEVQYYGYMVGFKFYILMSTGFVSILSYRVGILA